MDPSMMSAAGNGMDMQANMSALGLDPEMAELCMDVPETCVQCVPFTPCFETLAGGATVEGIVMTNEVSSALSAVAELEVLSADSSLEEKEKVLGLVRELTSALKEAAVVDGDAVVATTAVATIAVVKRSALSGVEVKSEDTAIKLPAGITGGGAASVTQYKELPVAEPKATDLEQKAVS